MKFSPPFLTLFSCTLMLSTIIALSASNPIVVWASLELNMMSFLPLISNDSKNNSSEASVKYFIAQAFGSALFLLAVATNLSGSTLSPAIIFLSLLLKLGGAPLHFWLPQVATSISWPSLATLATWQKITPLFVLSSWCSHQFALSLIGLLNIIVGGMSGFGQTKYRSIIVYSSISNLGWMIALTAYRLSMTMFFLIYSMHLIALVSLFNSFSQDSPTCSTLPLYAILFISILLLSLAGLPPTFGFTMKLVALFNMMAICNTPLIPYLMVVATIPTLYFYLHLIMSIIVSRPSTTVPSTPLYFLAIPSIASYHLIDAAFELAQELIM